MLRTYAEGDLIQPEDASIGARVGAIGKGKKDLPAFQVLSPFQVLS